jgi:hypothetical protein
MIKDEPKVSRKAYEIWEAEGRPHGRDQEHWHRAKAAVDAEQTAKPKRAPRKAAAPKTAAAKAAKPAAAKATTAKPAAKAKAPAAKGAARKTSAKTG